MKFLRFKIFLSFYLPFVFIVTTSFVVYLTLEHNHEESRMAGIEKTLIELARISVVRDFESVLPDIATMANQTHLQQFLAQGDNRSRQLVTKEFQSFLIQKRNYSMARIIDLNGMEVVRVNYNLGKTAVIPTEQLQNKSSRYYFRDSISLGLNELYISPIDLNIENEKIELPYQPVIRFAMPLFDNTNTKRGIIILNYRAEPILRHFDEMLTGTAGHVALLNENGHWIRSHKREREWAFMFGRTESFADRHPEVWDYTKEQEHGQMLVDDGLFTFATIYPIELIGGYSKEEVENEHIGHHHNDPKAHAWHIISDIPGSVLYKHTYEHIFGLLGAIWLFLILAGAYGSLIACRYYTERTSLRHIRDLHAKIYNTTTDGILITDADSNIISANNAFTDITGYTENEIVGKKPGILSSGKHDHDFYQRMWSGLKKDGTWVGEVINRHKNNNLYHEWLRISAVKDSDGNTINYVAMISDITEKKELEHRLKNLAHRDTLTGLRNRYAFEEDLKKITLHAQTHNLKFALLYLDLDKFKPINDNFGHAAGDAVLQIVAQRLMNQVRGMDKIARIGGDEFTVILNNIERREDAEKITAEIAESIEQPIHYKDNTFSISVSIGVVIFPDDADDMTTLISRADKAMYTIKLHTHLQA